MSRNLRGMVFGWLCCLLLVVGNQIALADSNGQNGDQALTAWQQHIDTAKNLLTKPDSLANEKLDAVQAEMLSILNGARQFKIDQQRLLPSVRVQIDSLGPPPAENTPPEDPAVAKLRQKLQDEQAQINGRLKQADLLIVQSQEVLSNIGLLQQDKVKDRLFQRGPSPLSPVIWVSATSVALDAFDELLQSPLDWWRQIQDLRIDKATLILLPIAFVAAIIIAFPVRRWILRHWARRADEEAPRHTRRIVAAGAIGLAQVILPVIALIAVSWVLQSMVPPGRSLFFVKFITSAAVSLVLFTVIIGLATAAFSPSLPQWSLVHLPEGGARKIVNRVSVIAGIFAISNMAHTAAGQGGEPPANYTAVESLVVTVLVSLSLLSLLRSNVWRHADHPQSRLGFALRAVLLLIALAAPIAAMAGYPQMSSYLLRALFISFMVLGIALLARAVIHEAVTSLFLPGGSLNRRFANIAPLAQDSALRVAFWVRLLVDFLLWPPVVYGLLISYGLQASLLNVWVGQVLTGVRIGGVNLSLIDIIGAIVALIIGFLIVSWVKHWVHDRVLPNTRLDSGIRNSISTCIGYVGGLIVVLIAIMMLGIDLSNIALVAGALSVGIGFGLKTVVENFVSGILLLIERPVKTGDWISVGGTEGIVKSISVRSTEIETFDKASVILPNSELIANAVTNWTHKNRIARITISVSVDYNADTRKVRDILLICAKEHDRVMSIPPPSVLFNSFGDSSLRFELRCFIADTDDYGIVRSDLHYAINDAFRSEGVGMPYQLREVIMRHTTPPVSQIMPMPDIQAEERR